MGALASTLGAAAGSIGGGAAKRNQGGVGPFGPQEQAQGILQQMGGPQGIMGNLGGGLMSGPTWQKIQGQLSKAPLAQTAPGSKKLNSWQKLVGTFGPQFQEAMQQKFGGLQPLPGLGAPGPGFGGPLTAPGALGQAAWSPFQKLLPGMPKPAAPDQAIGGGGQTAQPGGETPYKLHAPGGPASNAGDWAKMFGG